MNTNCPECLTQPVAPIITTTYSIMVTNNDGCSDLDSMTLLVIEDLDLYVPNIFSPNGDNVNDEIGIYSARNDVQIDLFQIFDRWGNLVHSASNFLTGDPSSAWDGNWNGSPLNPGVYTYLVILHNENPGQNPISKYGNITLVR